MSSKTWLAMRTILELDSIEPPLDVHVRDMLKMNNRKYMVIGRTGWRAVIVPITAVNYEVE